MAKWRSWTSFWQDAITKSFWFRRERAKRARSPWRIRPVADETSALPDRPLGRRPWCWCGSRPRRYARSGSRRWPGCAVGVAVAVGLEVGVGVAWMSELKLESRSQLQLQSQLRLV